jgi:type II secretory pathway pseudopilin PulG
MPLTNRNNEKVGTVMRMTRRAMTLAEVVISTMLVGVVLVSALASVGAATKSWLATADQADGGTLARQLLTEITALNYEDPNQTPTYGLESGEATSPATRANFDDLDDYKDFSDSPPKNKAGTALANYSSWLRTADVTKLNASSYAAISDGSPDNGLRLITVTVTSPKGKVTTLNAYRSLAGGARQNQGVSETIVTWVSCDLTAGNASSVSSAVSVLNHATDQ